MKNQLKEGATTTRLNLRWSILSLFFLITVLSFCKQKSTNDTAELESPLPFTPNIPADVDPAIQSRLKQAGNFNELNKKFNEFSWQAFIAIMWPRNAQNQPMPKLTDPGTASWLGWKEAYQVFRSDGSVPTPWGSVRTGRGTGLSDTSFIGDTHARVFLSSNTPTGINIADEEDQAFAGKLFDQNGNVVVYEVLLNKAEYDYLVNNKLYNVNGQIAFSQNGGVVNFPKGDFAQSQVGAVEIKLAWKILENTDMKERYFHTTGYIYDVNINKFVKKDLGLIGFHISQKTATASQWVWSTFEHIDNLDENPFIGKDGKAHYVHPTLRDPNCELCPINVDVSNNNSTYQFNSGKNGDYWTVSGQSAQYYTNSKVMKTQAKRMVDIPLRVRQVNAMMQTYFKSLNSVWQYYQLIDTQYPLDQAVAPSPYPDSKDTTRYHLPESVANKPGGRPNLAYLTNISMETFFQLGNQPASNLIEADNWNSPITTFGTESCMGCHSSAGIYISRDPKTNKPKSGRQLSGDFSWLLTQRAH
jgi:hypothetical protein